jgi:hypothetical protein
MAGRKWRKHPPAPTATGQNKNRPSARKSKNISRGVAWFDFLLKKRRQRKAPAFVARFQLKAPPAPNQAAVPNLKRSADCLQSAAGELVGSAAG